MPDLVIAGANGYIGRTLVPPLTALGWTVRCGSRTPHHARRAQPDLDWVELDLDRAHTLEESLKGATQAVFLVRANPEQAARFVDAANAAGIQHVLAVASPHAPIELQGIPNTVLRTQIVIGEGSEGWTAARDLGLRVPLLVRPPWFGTRVQPLWEGDLQAAVSHAIQHRPVGTFDLPGPHPLSAEQMIKAVAAQRRMRPRSVALPQPITRLSALWLRMFTRVDRPVARRVVQQLTHETLLDEPGYWAQLDHPRLSFEHAARRMLRYEHKPARLPERFLESVARRLAGAGMKRSTPEPQG